MERDDATNERLREIERQPIAVECPECGAAWLDHSYKWGQVTEAARYVLKCRTCDAPLSIEKSGRSIVVRCCKSRCRLEVPQVSDEE